MTRSPRHFCCAFLFLWYALIFLLTSRFIVMGISWFKSSELCGRMNWSCVGDRTWALPASQPHPHAGCEHHILALFAYSTNQLPNKILQVYFLSDWLSPLSPIDCFVTSPPWLWGGLTVTWIPSVVSGASSSCGTAH